MPSKEEVHGVVNGSLEYYERSVSRTNHLSYRIEKLGRFLELRTSVKLHLCFETITERVAWHAHVVNGLASVVDEAEGDKLEIFSILARSGPNADNVFRVSSFLLVKRRLCV